MTRHLAALCRRLAGRCMTLAAELTRLAVELDPPPPPVSEKIPSNGEGISPPLTPNEIEQDLAAIEAMNEHRALHCALNDNHPPRWGQG